jgi:glutamate racemase
MIGIFDSGSGGLSVLAALRARAPLADIAYFGDIAHAPYGVRSSGELIALTTAGVGILKKMGAAEIVSACNSVSPAILSGAAGDVPTVEMTGPTARAMRAYADKRVLLIATPATIASGIYQNALESMVDLDVLAIADLAGAIEFAESDGRIALIVREAFASRKGNGYDCLLLGCTHYPIARAAIERGAREAFGPLSLINPAEAVAAEAAKRFAIDGSGTMNFAISKDSGAFRNRVAELYPRGGYTIEAL